MKPNEQENPRDSLAKLLEGSCQSLESAVEFLELDPFVDWEDEMLSAGIEECKGCGWWHESGELVHEDEEDTGYCEDCI